MKNYDTTLYALIACVGMLIALFICSHQRDKLKKEAVERGCAEWTVDTNGRAKWQWKNHVSSH